MKQQKVNLQRYGSGSYRSILKKKKLTQKMGEELNRHFFREYSEIGQTQILNITNY